MDIIITYNCETIKRNFDLFVNFEYFNIICCNFNCRVVKYKHIYREKRDKMSEISKKRKNSLISIFYFAVLITLYVLFIKYAFWTVSPFIIALLIAVGLQKPINAINKKTKISKKFLGILLVALIIILIFGLLTLAGYKIGTEFAEFGKHIMDKLDNTPDLIRAAADKLLQLADRLPKSFHTSISEAITNLRDKLLSFTDEGQTIIQERAAISELAKTVTENSVSAVGGADIPAEVTAQAGTPADKGSFGGFDFSVLSAPIGGIISVAQQIPSIIVAVLISIIACFFITSDYDNFTGVIKGMLSEEHEAKLIRVKHIIFNVLGKWCKSYAAILFITFCEISAGLWILKTCGAYKGNYILIISFCTAMLDILPVFGTGTVMVPWALISLFTHKIGLAIGLAIIYVIIFVVRQVLEPRLVSMNVGMHPVITLAAMYLGLQIFGFLGLIIVPISLVIIKTLNEEGIVSIWTVRKKDEAEIKKKPSLPTKLIKKAKTK